MSEDSYPTTRDGAEALARRGLTVTEIALALGVSKPTVCYHMRRLGIRADSRFSRRYDWKEIRAYYDAGHTMRECQVKFGFSGGAWSEAVVRGDIDPRPRAEPVESIFVIGPRRNRYHLKFRLLQAGLKEPRGDECRIDRWRERPLSLELHHINGNPRDNRLVNLALLCPNCHSQTPNWGGRNARRKAA